MSQLVNIDESFGGSLMPAAPAVVEKAIAEAQWTGTHGLQHVGNISIEAAESFEKSLTPRECYENSIAAHAAIAKIAKSICKAEWRLYGRDGREIVGGDLFERLRQPMPRVTRRRWVENIVCWYNISGEIAIDIGDGLFPSTLTPLNPYRLYIDRPGIPNTVDDIIQWRYTPFNGRIQYIRADHLIYDRMFNPNYSVRGLSPFVTGTTEIGAAHQAARYRKQFFENSAIPSHMLVLGEGVSRSQREDIQRRYTAEYSSYKGNAHKVMVVSGKDARIEQLEAPFQNSPFLDLSRWSAMQVALLFGVPPAVMQFDATTKFDNANEQRLMFVEDTLMPQMEMLQDVFQIQLVDPYYSYSSVEYADRSRKNQRKMKKAMEDAFDARRTDSNIVLLIDADTMPIMATIKADQVAKAKETREVLMMSPTEIAEYYGFDIPARPERDEIYILNNYVCATNDEINKRLSPQLQAKEQTVAQNAKEDRKEQRQAMRKAFDAFARKLRKLALAALDQNEPFSLADADAIDELGYWRDPIRVIRHEVKAMLSADDPKRATKDYFNRLKLDSVCSFDGNGKHVA